MVRLTRRDMIGAALAGAVPLLARPARAQAPPAPILEGAVPPPGPGAANPPPPATAPAGLAPGMRFVWYGGAASIANTYNQLEPDEKGGWIDRATGRRYGEFETPSSAGAGFSVLDILAAGPAGYLAGQSGLLIHAEAGNATSFIDSNGLVSGPDNIGDYWISPARLSTLTDTAAGGARVLHMPYTLAGRSFRALLLQSQSSAGWTQSLYDVDTGLLMTQSSSTQGGTVLVRGPSNQLTPGAGNTQLTYVRFAGAREVNIPGRGSVFPDAIKKLRQLYYQGIWGFIGISAPPGLSDARWEITSNSDTFLTARVASSNFMGMGPLLRERVVPAGVIGSLWMSPALLEEHGQSAVLDQDPITGVQLAALGRSGNLVVFAAQTRISRYGFGYDARSGILAYYDASVVVGPTTHVGRFQLVSTQ